jgi:hypothetical protein
MPCGACHLGRDALLSMPSFDGRFSADGRRTARRQRSGSPALRRGVTPPPQGPAGGRYSLRVLVCCSRRFGAGGTTPAPTPRPPVPPANHFPAFNQTSMRELAVDAFFEPILARVRLDAWQTLRPIRPSRPPQLAGVAGNAWRVVSGAVWPAVPAGPRRGGPAFHPRGWRAACAGAARAP